MSLPHSAHSVTALPRDSGRRASIGSLLVERGKLSPEDTERILSVQKAQGLRFGEAARRLGLLSDSDIRQVLSQQFDYPVLLPEQIKYSPELIAAYQPFCEQAETLRTVRTQLMQQWFDARRKTLVVASLGRSEGASFFAANLAVVLSQLEKPVLLLDANLRHPRQHEIFGMAGRQGLSDILADRIGMENLSHVEGFPNLFVLPAGTLPPNPQELVSRSSFGELLADLSNRFDAILVDAPAFSEGADTLAIAARVGGVLLACRNNITRVDDVTAVPARLSCAGARIVGSVLLDF
jgi:chain length determinant protein tyrosine kinase EpsG